MKDKELSELINSTDWIFAKTYAKVAPHFYIRRRSSKDLFWELLKRIRKHGRRETFTHYWEGKKKTSNFSYYYFEGYKYWTIDPYDPFSIIINRVEAIDV